MFDVTIQYTFLSHIILKTARSLSPNAKSSFIEAKINDNPFAYTIEKREQLIDNIFNKIKGFGYSSFKTETSFKPYLTCGDLIKFKRKDGVLVNTILLRYKHNFDEITLEAPSVIKATVKYIRPQTEIDIAKRTEYLVDQSNQQIQSIVTETENLQDSVTELGTTMIQNKKEFEFSISGLTDIVNSNNENIRDEISNINGTLENGVETLKNSLVTININGIQVSTNLSKVSTLITNDSFKIIPVNNPDEPLAFFGYDEKEGRSKSEMDNLTVKNYLSAGYHRQEKFELDGEKRTGWFYVGGDI